MKILQTLKIEKEITENEILEIVENVEIVKDLKKDVAKIFYSLMYKLINEFYLLTESIKKIDVAKKDNKTIIKFTNNQNECKYIIITKFKFEEDNTYLYIYNFFESRNYEYDYRVVYSYCGLNFGNLVEITKLLEEFDDLLKA